MKTLRPLDTVVPETPHSPSGYRSLDAEAGPSNPPPARASRKGRQPSAALAPQPPAPAAPTGLPERRRTDAETHAFLRPACVPTSSRACTSSRTSAGSRTLQVPTAWGRGERVVDIATPPYCSRPTGGPRRMLSCAHMCALPRRFPRWTESGVGGLEEAPRTRQGKVCGRAECGGFVPSTSLPSSD